MSAFLQQVFSLLTTNTGSLAYNLVLAFSIVAALLVAISQLRGQPSPQATLRFRRMLIGLSLLLLLRIALFLAAGLAWAEVINPGVVLPVLERGVDLLGLLVIVWLWAFPQPSLAADIATGLIALVLVTLTLFGVMASLNLGIAQPFNGSLPDQNAQLVALVVAGLGVLFLAIRRPPGWPIGLVMLIVLAFGSLFQYLIPGDGEFPGAVRLAQMIAYPLLIALPYRFGVSPIVQPIIAGAEVAALQTDHPDLERSGLPVEQLLQDWAQASDTHQSAEILAAILAQDLNADLCLFLWPPDDAGHMTCNGYDLIHRLPISDTILASQSLPVIAPAFNHGSPLRLPGNSKAPDLLALARALNLERTGSLLSVPVMVDSGQPLVQVVMLSPSSSHRWSSADEQRLAVNAIPLAHILQRNREIVLVQAELAETRLALQSTQERMAKAESDRTSLKELVYLLQPTYGNPSTPSNSDPAPGQEKGLPPELKGDDAQSPKAKVEADGMASANEDDGDGWVYDIDNKPPPVEG